MMNNDREVLAIDLWDKNCGIAISINNIAIPKEIVPRTKLIKKVKSYIIDHNIETIVVGLPFDLYNIKTKQLEKTQKFICKLKKIFEKQEIIGIDERFSSIEADWYNKGLYRQKRDDVAAQVILDTYLNTKNI